jgi:MarR family transcriptional regulator, negative regulator of the multidrug operon emrRAB
MADHRSFPAGTPGAGTNRAGDERLANLLGALAVALTDLGDQALAGPQALVPNDLAALNVVAMRSHTTTIYALSRRLALSHSAAVRLADRLQVRGWLQRAPGADARTVELALTPAGRAARWRALNRRQDMLLAAVQQLELRERRSLAPLIGQLLGALTPDRIGSDRICRLCQVRCCPQAQCPVELAARAREQLGAAP